MIFGGLFWSVIGLSLFRGRNSDGDGIKENGSATVVEKGKVGKKNINFDFGFIIAFSSDDLIGRK